MLDVFRFAWFAVRTFFGVIALALALEGAMWALVKVQSMAAGNSNLPTTSQRANAHNAHDR